MNQFLAGAPEPRSSTATWPACCRSTTWPTARRAPMADGEVLDLGHAPPAVPADAARPPQLGERPVVRRDDPRPCSPATCSPTSGDGPALTETDVVEPALAAEELFHSTVARSRTSPADAPPPGRPRAGHPGHHARLVLPRRRRRPAPHPGRGVRRHDGRPAGGDHVRDLTTQGGRPPAEAPNLPSSVVWATSSSGVIGSWASSPRLLDGASRSTGAAHRPRRRSGYRQDDAARRDRAPARRPSGWCVPSAAAITTRTKPRRTGPGSRSCAGCDGSAPWATPMPGCCGPLQPDPDGAAAGGDRAHSRFEIADRMVHALTEAAGDGPLLLGIDDLHAADPSSLRIVEFLAAVLDDLPLAVVATSRVPQPVTRYETLLVEILRHPAASELVVPGLSAGDVAAYLEAATGQGTDVADEVWHLTAGNPMYVREVARILGESDRAPLDRVPVRLTGALRTRLSGLGPPARRVLDALAVLGVEADPDLLSMVAGDAVDAAVADAVVGGGRRAHHRRAGDDRALPASAAPRGRLRRPGGRVPKGAARAGGGGAGLTPFAAGRCARVHLCAAARPETAAAAVEAARSAAARAAGSTPTRRRRPTWRGRRRSTPSRPIRIPPRPWRCCSPPPTPTCTPACSTRRSTATAPPTPTPRTPAWPTSGRRPPSGTRRPSASLASPAPGAATARSCSSNGWSDGPPTSGMGPCERGCRRRWPAPGSSSTRASGPRRLAGDAVLEARRAGASEAIAFTLECLRTVTWARAGRERRGGAVCRDRPAGVRRRGARPRAPGPPFRPLPRAGGR